MIETAHDEIRRLQIYRSKELLAFSDLGDREICIGIGPSAKHFQANFMKSVGESVDDFRHRHGPLGHR